MYANACSTLVLSAVYKEKTICRLSNHAADRVGLQTLGSESAHALQTQKLLKLEPITFN